MSTPAIVLIGPEHPDELLGAFARYQHEYDVRLVRSCREALEATRDILDGGATVALYATESVVPDAESVLHAFHKLREKVPTARRVIAAHWERFIADAPPLRGSSTAWTQAWRCSSAASTAAVSSCEPSSTRMIRSGRNSWRATLSTARSIVAARLKHGITTS